MVFQSSETLQKYGVDLQKPTLAERVKVVQEHLDFSIRWKGERVGIVEMRRHYANYFKGIPNFKPVRNKLVTINDKDELFSVVAEIENQYEMALL